MEIRLTERYAPRPVARLGIEERAGWRLKVYGIAHGREEPRRELVAAALAAADARLPAPPVTRSRYGVGFVGVHDGRGGNFVFVDWWGQENELHHHVLFSSSDVPAELRGAVDGDPIACVWDLAVVAHERCAWIAHVLAPERPDLDAYLEDFVTGTI